jgi:hypothetical protein
MVYYIVSYEWGDLQLHVSIISYCHTPLCAIEHSSPRKRVRASTRPCTQVSKQHPQVCLHCWSELTSRAETCLPTPTSVQFRRVSTRHDAYSRIPEILASRGPCIVLVAQRRKCHSESVGISCSNIEYHVRSPECLLSNRCMTTSVQALEMAVILNFFESNQQ